MTALTELIDFKLAHGMSPFGDCDESGTVLSEAYSLMVLLTAVAEDSQGRVDSALSALSPEVVGGAYDGVKRLMALGAFLAKKEAGR